MHRRLSRILTVVSLPALLATSRASVAEAAPRRASCGTMELLPSMIGRRDLVADLGPRPQPTPPFDKVVRDVYGEWANVRESQNFAIKWGPEGIWNRDLADLLLASFEQGWQTEIVEMGFVLPVGSDEFKLNVYIGETGGPLEDTDYAAYAGIDPEGYPFIAIAASTSLFDTESNADFSRVTAVHEFFHTVQTATLAYDMVSNYDAYWYWEATADWITAEVYPDSKWARGFIPYYTMAPHVAMELVEFPDPNGFEISQLHHYGAAIFPRYLSEHVADWSVVRDSWMTAGPGDDPFSILDGLLVERGAETDGLFADFAAHNVRFDYAHPEIYQDWAEQLGRENPGQDLSISAEVDASGTGGWLDAPEATLPHPKAYNVIRMEAPEAGDLRVSVEADPQGSLGTTARMRSRVVRELADGLQYVPLEGDDTHGEAVITGVGDEIALFLVVAADPVERDTDETLAYRYALEYVDAAAGPEEPPPGGEPDPEPAGEPSTPTPEGGCACTLGSTDSSRDLAAAAVISALALSFARRRRRVASSSCRHPRESPATIAEPRWSSSPSTATTAARS